MPACWPSAELSLPPLVDLRWPEPRPGRVQLSSTEGSHVSKEPLDSLDPLDLAPPLSPGRSDAGGRSDRPEPQSALALPPARCGSGRSRQSSRAPHRHATDFLSFFYDLFSRQVARSALPQVFPPGRPLANVATDLDPFTRSRLSVDRRPRLLALRRLPRSPFRSMPSFLPLSISVPARYGLVGASSREGANTSNGEVDADVTRPMSATMTSSSERTRIGVGLPLRSFDSAALPLAVQLAWQEDDGGSMQGPGFPLHALDSALASRRSAVTHAALPRARASGSSFGRLRLGGGPYRIQVEPDATRRRLRAARYGAAGRRQGWRGASVRRSATPSDLVWPGGAGQHAGTPLRLFGVAGRLAARTGLLEVPATSWLSLPAALLGRTEDSAPRARGQPSLAQTWAAAGASWQTNPQRNAHINKHARTGALPGREAMSIPASLAWPSPASGPRLASTHPTYRGQSSCRGPWHDVGYLSMPFCDCSRISPAGAQQDALAWIAQGDRQAASHRTAQHLDSTVCALIVGRDHQQPGGCGLEGCGGRGPGRAGYSEILVSGIKTAGSRQSLQAKTGLGLPPLPTSVLSSLLVPLRGPPCCCYLPGAVSLSSPPSTAVHHPASCLSSNPGFVYYPQSLARPPLFRLSRSLPALALPTTTLAPPTSPFQHLEPILPSILRSQSRPSASSSPQHRQLQQRHPIAITITTEAPPAPTPGAICEPARVSSSPTARPSIL
ncbi:uncharacterized protein PSFLO_00850 [Pseudozyma flocculosa]|uniref:Uncharacterized protein n=1 Tax=Pseudozyma flocculosa TaxID=84751 RepID=A0A5C3EW56_9BASI|nr:uncharacterized protein PSFLO_00850 [Pseudozyma flocculosa]